jgi:hypothetical protein
VCVTNDQRSYPRCIPLQTLQRQDRMALLWSVFLRTLEAGCKLRAVIAAVRISCAKFQNSSCRCCRYQSMLTPSPSDPMPSTLLRRRSQPTMPGFPRTYFYIRYSPFSERTFYLRKERNGRSTGKLLLRHSRRYVPTVVHRPMLSSIARKIID